MASEMRRKVRKAAGRVKRGTAGVARRKARAVADRKFILRSGVFDQEWVEEQLGRRFSRPADAVDAYLQDSSECTPHPLFCAQWIDREDGAPPPGQNPLVWYLTTRRVNRHHSPHPLVELDRLPRRYSDHPTGPWAGWIADLRPDSLLPVPDGMSPITWASARAASIEAVRAWHDGAQLRTSRRVTSHAPVTIPEPVGPAPATPAGESPRVSVVMPMWNRGTVVRRAIESVQAQTWQDWELIVVDDGSEDDGAAVVDGLAAFDPRIRCVRSPHVGVSAARNTGLEQAKGRYVAFLDTDNTWRPGFLQVMLEQLQAGDWEMAHAVLRANRGGKTYYRAFEGTHQHLLGGNYIDLNVLVARTDVVREVGGFDVALRRGVDYDLVLKLAERHPLHLVPYLGADYDDTEQQKPERPRQLDGDTFKRTDPGNRISTSESTNWLGVIRSNHLARWDDARGRERTPGLTSVILPARGPVQQAVNTMKAFAGEDDIEVVIVSPRQARWRSALVNVVGAAMRQARVEILPADWSRATIANIGLARSSGEFAVIALERSRFTAEAVRRLVEELTSPDVALVQPTLLTSRGDIDAAGAAFRAGTTRPQPFLRGHAARDATRLERLTLPAAYGSVVAVRAAEAVAARGFDPLIGDELASTDLSLRLGSDGGRTVLRPDAVIVVQRPPADPSKLAEGMSLLERRHPAPAADSAECWAAAGFEVVDYANEIVVLTEGEDPADLKPNDLPFLVPHAVVRAPRVSITERAPSLRWTIDLASPPGRVGEGWGDTHYGEALARSLERLGQRVAVDNRSLRHRTTRDHDDVLLVLRGLDEVRPRPGCLNLEWIISHPELVNADEIRSFDRVYAASMTWPTRIGEIWGVDVHPLLQATDPDLFHPGRDEFDSGAEVLFVGNARRVFRPGVRHAIGLGADLEVHGRGWDRFIDRQHVKSTMVDNADLGSMYTAAGVVLNDHWEDMRQLGFVSNRIIDAAASGARVASDDIPGVDLTSMFHGLVQTWHDEGDLGRILAERDTLYPSAEERLSAAVAVASEHSFDARAQTLLDDAVRLLSERTR